jgi:hypothetical protein
MQYGARGVRVSVEKRTAAKVWLVKERLIGATIRRPSASRCDTTTHLDAVNGPA